MQGAAVIHIDTRATPAAKTPAITRVADELAAREAIEEIDRLRRFFERRAELRRRLLLDPDITP